MNQDESHLHLISIFYYVVAGLAALFSCIPFIHVTLGILMLTGTIKDTDTGEAMPALVGWLFISIGACIILAGWILTVLFTITGRFIAKRKRYTFCLVMAAVSCIFMPFGTVLGVFTIIVLSRPTVKQLYGITP